jgi:hypothetical protein
MVRSVYVLPYEDEIHDRWSHGVRPPCAARAPARRAKRLTVAVDAFTAQGPQLAVGIHLQQPQPLSRCTGRGAHYSDTAWRYARGDHSPD